MIQTSVNTKYQIVIPKAARKKIKVKPGQKFNMYLTEDKIILSTKRIWPQDYLKNLRGLLKGIDIKTFVENERASWGSRYQK